MRLGYLSVRMPLAPHSARLRGFTLIELLLVIAVIGIMASLIVSAILNAASDSRNVLARQQQAVVQEALNSWVSYQSSSGTKSLGSARATYNGTSATNRLLLIKDYLDPTTYSHITNYTTDYSKIQTEAMKSTKQYLQFSDWATNGSPRVDMVAQ